MSTVEAYDPRTGQWSRRADLPQPRSAISATTGADGRIYVFGGEELTAGSIAVYDPRTNRWTERSAMPAHRMYAAAATGPNGALYLIGGFEPAPTCDDSRWFSSVERYTP